ncbi:MAG TPA: hypothetical protein VN493_01235 [Thermoanaerobaculia bacterium]|nr:hypothetical protein [Thermoanaerobaculia bacterium]
MASLVAHVQLCKAKGAGGDKLRTRSWVEIQLVGEDDSPIPSERYALKLPGGKLLEGTLDDQGMVRIEGIPPGQCQVVFPDLDKTAWTPVKAQSGQAASE